MLTGDGRLKILDFGLAKETEDIRAAETAMPTASLTGEGRIVGTVAYMSPEQAEAKPVDQRSDVFSLGVILYEMASGVRPFRGDTQMSTLSAIIKDAPKPLAELRPGLPREFVKVVNRCLAKDPDDRYQSAKDVRNDLRDLKSDLASGEVQAPGASGDRGAAAPAPLSRRHLPLIVGGVLTAAAIGVLSTLWLNSRGQLESRTTPFDSIRLTQLTTTGAAGSPAISPDGRYVAYVTIQEGKWSLSLRQVATASSVELIAPEETRHHALTFGPDGNHVYYVTTAVGGTLGTL
jgi:serine/threonine protein kinase